MKVVVIGSVNIDYTLYVKDFPKDGETIDGISQSKQLGGKGANQAVALSRSGTSTTFITSIGNDEDGLMVEKTLKNEKMNLILNKCNSSTGNATIIVNENAENKIIIMHGANYKLDKKVIDSYLELIKEADYILIQNEISNEVNEYILKIAFENKIKTIYNPAPYREMKKELFSYITYVTPNETELAKMTQDVEGDIQFRAHYLNKLGVKNIIVTLGSKGSYYLVDGEEGFVPAFKVKAVDTVAAGDTFNGYLIAGLIKGFTIEKALRFASKASSIAVSRYGAIPSIPYLHEIEY